MDANLVEIFYLVDEFCKEFYKTMEGHNHTVGDAKLLQPIYYDQL